MQQTVNNIRKRYFNIYKKIFFQQISEKLRRSKKKDIGAYLI